MQDNTIPNDQFSSFPGSMPPAPAPLSRPQKAWQWYRTQRKRTKIGLGCGLLLAVLLLCSCVSSIAAAGTVASTIDASTPTPAPASTQDVAAASSPSATATPTSMPTATPTSAPAQTDVTHGYTHVGGPLSDFAGKYKSLAVSNTGFTDEEDSIFIATRVDSTNIVNYVGVSGPENWTTEKSRSYCLQFVPSDAVKYNEDDQLSYDIIIDFHSSVGMIVVSINSTSCMVYIGDQ